MLPGRVTETRASSCRLRQKDRDQVLLETACGQSEQSQHCEHASGGCRLAGRGAQRCPARARRLQLSCGDVAAGPGRCRAQPGVTGCSARGAGGETEAIMWEVDQKCNGYALLAENRFIFFPTWKYRRIFLLGQQIGFLVTSNPDTSLRRTSHHSVSQNVPVQLISSRRADTFLTLLSHSHKVWLYISFLGAASFSWWGVRCVFSGPAALGTFVLAWKQKRREQTGEGLKAVGRFEGMRSS